MFEIIGKYNQATVYAATVDSEAYAQVLRMCNREELKDCRIRMMPDMHAAEGCTVGTSMTVGDRVNPAYVGGDIGCGMQVYRLDKSPMAYRRMAEIETAIAPTAEVKDILTPLYNFKASSTAAIDEETRDGED